jgi:hypothetical protein
MKSNISLKIGVNLSIIPMGHSVRVEAQLQTSQDNKAEFYVLLPYVNQRRWGSPERPNAEGKATFLLPLPNPGSAHIQVVAVPAHQDYWMGVTEPSLLMAGRLMQGEGIHSNVIPVNVTWRNMIPIPESDTLFGMQWEPWFTPQSAYWQSAQAVPVMGFYESYNWDVIRQHILWFMDLGVDFILLDWSNHIWGCKHWNERSDGVNSILHATQLMMEVLAEMRSESLAVPKVALMPGISNGPPATMEALNEEFDWIYQNYLRTPRFSGLWQEMDGKPLVVVLDTGAVAHPDGTAESAFRIPFFKQTLGVSAEELDSLRVRNAGLVDDTHFTVRWMSSQNQTTRHHELGYWSWMDGVVDLPVTYRDGTAEAATVSTGFFHIKGWKSPDAYGRRGGATYIETFNAALKHRPRVILLHQFNEFAGQAEGHGYGPDRDIYVDSYSVELSDDIEPVSLTAIGYRGDAGGWGFYYLNLTQALINLYRQDLEECTIMGVSSPLRNSIASGKKLHITWSVAGKVPESYSVLIDNTLVAENIKDTAFSVPLDNLYSGTHILTVTAKGAVTLYPLSWTEMDQRLSSAIPVSVNVPFVLK